MTFTLADIKPTRRIMPIRMMLHAPQGIGKSSFAASVPGIVIIPTEDGVDNVDAVAFPKCESLDDFWSCMTVLRNESHSFTSVAIDTTDHLEKLIHEKVCSEHKKKTITDFGYGNGYKYALNYWHKVIASLENLRCEKGMEYYLLAHSQVKRFDDPLTDSYDRYQIRMHDSANKYIQEIVDIIGFANQVTYTKDEDLGFNKKRARVQATDIRKIFLQKSQAYDAKSRIQGMPSEVDLSYPAFRAALDAARGIR